MKVIKHEDYLTAMEKATETLGCDPAYYGEEGGQQVDKELIKLGYTNEDLEYTQKVYGKNKGNNMPFSKDLTVNDIITKIKERRNYLWTSKDELDSEPNSISRYLELGQLLEYIEKDGDY